MECRYGMPEWLQLVPVDFEAGESWREKAAGNGFDAERPAVVVSTGVIMYLTLEAYVASLREVATLVPGSTLATTFLLPLEQAVPEVRPALEMAAKGAEASGTPFITFLRPEEMMALAREAGFRDVEHVSAEALAELYFLDRTNGLRAAAQCRGAACSQDVICEVKAARGQTCSGRQHPGDPFGSRSLRLRRTLCPCLRLEHPLRVCTDLQPLCR